MDKCLSVPSAFFPNAKLCEWMVQTRVGDPTKLDIGDRYVDLGDPKNPRYHQSSSNGKIEPSELNDTAISWLEEEWKRFFQNETPSAQPVALALYDQFHFLPPWLPKPWERLLPEEREQIRKIARIARSVQDPLDVISRMGIHYEKEQVLVEEDLLRTLNQGRATCVGMSHLFYFAQAIILGKEAKFSEIYQGPDGKPQAHVGVVLKKDSRFYDPSNHIVLGGQYQHYDLAPTDQWAFALMNTALAKHGALILSPEEEEKIYRRAQELAPNHFRTQFNVGLFLWHNGHRKEGLLLLKGAHRVFPQYHLLAPLLDLIRE